MGKNSMRCAECGSEDIISDYEAGELVCERCGFVVHNAIIDQGPEWRAFDHIQSDERARVGAPLKSGMHDHGLSTVIDWRNKDYSGRNLTSDEGINVSRLRKWDRRSRISESKDKNLAFAFSELTKWGDKLNLPKNVLDTAAVIYRHSINKHVIRGRSIQGIAVAALYMACRQCNVIRTLGHITRVAQISKKEGGRNYRFLLKTLQTKVPTASPNNYVSKMINQLNLSGETEIIALRILENAAELKLTLGRGPGGIAGAATYIASLLMNERITQGEIAKMINVTEVTIRNRYKELTRKIYFKLVL